MCLVRKDANNLKVGDVLRNVQTYVCTHAEHPATLPLPCIVRLSDIDESYSMYLFVFEHDEDSGLFVGFCIDGKPMMTERILIDPSDDATTLHVFQKMDDGTFAPRPLDPTIPVIASKCKFGSDKWIYFPCMRRFGKSVRRLTVFGNNIVAQELIKVCNKFENTMSSDDTTTGEKRKVCESAQEKPQEEKKVAKEAVKVVKEVTVVQKVQEKKEAKEVKEVRVVKEVKEAKEVEEGKVVNNDEAVDAKLSALDAKILELDAKAHALDVKMRELEEKTRVADAEAKQIPGKVTNFMSDSAKKFQLLSDQAVAHYDEYREEFNGCLERANDQVLDAHLLIDHIREKSAVMDSVLARAGAQPRPFVQWVREGLKRSLQENNLRADTINFVAINMQARVGMELFEFAIRLPRQILHFINEMDDVSNMHDAGWAVPLQRMIHDALNNAFDPDEMTRVMDIAMNMKANMPGCTQLFDLALRLPLPLCKPMHDANMIEDAFSHMPFGAILRDALERVDIDEVANLDYVGFDAVVSFFDDRPAKRIMIALPDTLLRLMITTTPITPKKYQYVPEDVAAACAAAGAGGEGAAAADPSFT